MTGLPQHVLTIPIHTTGVFNLNDKEIAIEYLKMLQNNDAPLILAIGLPSLERDKYMEQLWAIRGHKHISTLKMRILNAVKVVLYCALVRLRLIALSAVYEELLAYSRNNGSGYFTVKGESSKCSKVDKQCLRTISKSG